jgi:hypothetical protein
MNLHGNKTELLQNTPIVGSIVLHVVIYYFTSINIYLHMYVYVHEYMHI